MNENVPVRLADDVLIEPLINEWVACWLTVAPAPASLHLTNFQLRALRSYLQNPQMHLQMAQEPSLSGSAFVGVPPAQADAVRALIQRSEQELGDCIELAAALESFQAVLLAEGRGQSLEPLYARIPAPLRGKVELVYDLLNRPSMRLLEGALYRSRYYKPQLQSLRLSTLQADDERPFFLSTPRVRTETQVDWKIPFADERVDALFRLDLHPRPFAEVLELIGSPPPALARAFFTDAPAPHAPRWTGPGVRIRYVGHACVLIETPSANVLTDALVGVRPARGGMPRLSYAELPERIDCVVITHAHSDHFVLETLLRLRHRMEVLVVPHAPGVLLSDPSLRALARTLGFQRVISVEPFDQVPLPGGAEIVAVPFFGEHGDLMGGRTGYLVRCGSEQVLVAADSACLDVALYEDLRSWFGPVSTVFMNTETEGAPVTFGIEALFPRKRDRAIEKGRRARGSNAREGLQLLKAVGASRVYNYAMGLEPWLRHVLGPASPDESARMKDSDMLIAEARGNGLVAERLRGSSDIHLQP